MYHHCTGAPRNLKYVSFLLKKSNVEALKEVDDTRAAATKQSDGLDYFQLIPRDINGKPKLKGVALLDHMSKFRNIRFVADGIK